MSKFSESHPACASYRIGVTTHPRILTYGASTCARGGAIWIFVQVKEQEFYRGIE